MRTKVVALLLAALFAFAGVAAVTASPAPAANQSQQGLVNVAIGDISTGDILSNNTVNVAVAANIAATVCGVTVRLLSSPSRSFRRVASAVQEQRSSWTSLSVAS